MEEYQVAAIRHLQARENDVIARARQLAERDRKSVV